MAEASKRYNTVCAAANLLGGLYYALGNYDSAMWYHHKTLRLAQKDNPDAAAQACLGLAEIFILKAAHDSTLPYLNQGLSITRKNKDRPTEAGVYNNLGNLYLAENNFTAALENFIKAANLYDSLPGQRAGLAKALVNIGNVENVLGHPEKALDYTQRSLVIFKENGDDMNVAYGHKLMGRIYRRQSAYDKALAEYGEAITLYRKAGNQHELSEAHHGIGSIYYDMQKFQAALDEYMESLRIAKNISAENQVAYAYTAVGYAWYELKNFKRSIAYFDSALTQAKHVHNRYLMMDSYQILSGIYDEQHQPGEALRYLTAYTQLKDSLYSEENRTALDEMEAKYQNAKKQSEIDLLQKDQQLRTAELRQSRLALYALLAGGALLGVIGALIFNRYRLISNARRQLEIEKVRQHIGRDLHDDIGSTLSTIHIVSQFAISENKPENFVKHFQVISEQSARMLENMSDMVWSINPANDSIENMVIKMREFCGEILEPKNIAYIFQGEETLAAITLSLEARKNIFLIFKECINNTAKYSGASQVRVCFEKSGKCLQLSVADNGKGFDEQTIKPGNGLRNMRERAAHIQATLQVESSPHTGTTLQVTLTT